MDLADLRFQRLACRLRFHGASRKAALRWYSRFSTSGPPPHSLFKRADRILLVRSMGTRPTPLHFTHCSGQLNAMRIEPQRRAMYPADSGSGSIPVVPQRPQFTQIRGYLRMHPPSLLGLLRLLTAAEPEDPSQCEYLPPRHPDSQSMVED